jgi:hypothetical protein
MKRRIEELNEEFVRQYENYVNGNLQRDRFKTTKEEIVAERSRLGARSRRLKSIGLMTTDWLLRSSELLISEAAEEIQNDT